ncbi:MAG TPA: VWA domain-containing protein [Gemmatimonadaceae bacterium]
MRIGSLCCVLAAVVIAGAVGIGQDRQVPSFNSGVQVVRIDVSVLDGKREPVRGLQASDFTVLEDGQPRPIRSFQAVDARAARTTRAAAMPPMALLPAHNVVTNQVSSDTSRLIFILMDRSMMPQRPMIVARQIADAAIDAMEPGDLAAIVTTGVQGVAQNLTSDRARLHKTIASSDWSQKLSRAITDTEVAGTLDLNNDAQDGRCMCGLCAMDTITQIANAVRDTPRRKVLLFIGSAITVQAGDSDCAPRLRESREKLYDALGTSGLTVHSIDPQGMASVGPAARATVRNGVPKRDGRVLNEQLQAERTEFMAAQGSLAVLPDLTGGRVIINDNEPFRLVPDVLRESDASYLVGFEPIEATGDVRHDIQVKVARDGVAVHTARYIAPASGPTAPSVAARATSPLERALIGLLPDPAPPLGMSVAAFAGPDRDHASVGITLDASAFADRSGSIPLEIAVLASDEHGKTAGGARQTGTVQVPYSTAGDSAFVELQTFVTLPAGVYELRAAVMNGETQAAASVFTHLTVPSFDTGSLALSDLVLGTRESTTPPQPGAPAMPIVPTTARVFRADTPAWAFLRVYRAGDTDAERVALDVTVLDGQGRRVKHQSLPNASFSGRQADVRLSLPMKGLAPGAYILRLDAKQARVEASREVAFAVTSPAPVMAPTVHTPELDAALDAAAAYLDRYEHRISAIGAEEQYEQAVAPLPGAINRPNMAVNAPPIIRRTRANIMTLGMGARGWVAFRDVFEVDGKPVREREERLSHILQNVTPDSLEQARQIAIESARYNLDPETTHINRTINVPMTALLFLRGANQARSAFHLGKPERVNGIDCVTLQFTERLQPRLIRTGDDVPAQGTIWIDMANGGRIVKTELAMDSGGAQAVRSRTAVTYARVDKRDLWVPTVMDETYEVTATRQVLTGRATYSDFREFKVTTSEGIK